MIKRYVLLAGSAQFRTVQTRNFGTFWPRENYRRITYALQNPDTVDPDGRLGAVVATQKYKPDQVGYGVHAATILIYLVFRDLGQQKVGKEFGLRYAQEILESPRNFRNNKLFGTIDQGYWIGNMGKGETLPDNIVICIGANINPTTRAIIQELLAKIRKPLDLH